MKKVIVTLAMAAMAMVSVNAQLVLGGDISFEFQNDKQDNNVTDLTTINLSFDPKIGYALNDKMEVGAYLGVGYNYKNDNIIKRKTYGVTWEVKPYFCYNIVTFGRFGLDLEATAGVGGVEDTQLSVGVNVAPNLTFELNEHWSLETELNFLSLGYNMTKDFDLDKTTNKFGLGVDLDNIATLGAITIGATYKF